MTRESLIMRLPAAASLLALLALGACATDQVAAGGTEPITPTERYAIEVTPTPQELRLATHAGGLSHAQTDALASFASQWTPGGGDITIKTPEHGPDPAAAFHTASAARDLLISDGADPERVRIIGYEAAGDAHAPVVVGYMRYRARGPDCGRAWEDLSRADSNAPYNNYGCALTANVAAEIANPADLLSPRQSDPPDAQRRQAVLDSYRKPTITSTPVDPQAEGTLANVGN